jgi:hypothetical protein
VSDYLHADDLEDLLDDAFAYMSRRAQQHAANAQAALDAWQESPAYLRTDAPADTERKLLDSHTRWLRESEWLTHKPEALLSIELILIPAHAGVADAAETLERLAAAGSHLPIIGLVVGQA